MHPDAPRIPQPNQATDADQRRQWLRVETEAAARLEKARQAMLISANAKRRDESFRVGDQVLLSTKHPWFQHTADGVRKLIPAWVGPFPVTAVPNAVTYQLQLPEDIKCADQFHVSLLKKYHADTRVIRPPQSEFIDGHEEFTVEAVVGHRIRKLRSGSREEYRVAFQGYGPHHNKWLPLANLEGCAQAIAEYHTRRHAGIGTRAIARGPLPLHFLPFFPFLQYCALPREFWDVPVDVLKIKERNLYYYP